LNPRGARTIFVNAPRASILSRCPGSRGHVCCNYLTINLYVGCIIGCSYCIMRQYLNFSPVVVNVATERTIEEVLSIAKSNPEKAIRIGTGEVGDSLDLDPIFGLSAPLVEGLGSAHNVAFELKTKRASIGHILSLGNKGNAVIGFSLSPSAISDSEEGSASPVDERISSARLAADSGFRVAFHFDPVFRYDGWETGYGDVIRRVSALPRDRIAWISLGTFRYPAGLKEKIGDRWYIYDEFVECRDGKYRYLQKTRREIYSFLVAAIRERYPTVPVYLCMESEFVWEKVFAAHPHEIPGLREIFERPDLGQAGLRFDR
jgi:spore photoproduct lyase